MKRIWKNIVGYEKLYKISNYGEVFTMPRQVIRKNGVVAWYKGRLMKQRKGGSKETYWRVGLTKDNKQKHIFVHKLILETFVGFCPQGMECCHNDGNNFNNNLKNLRWDTPENNIIDKIKHRGHAGPLATLTPQQVLEIKQSYDPTNTFKTIGKKYGVNRRTIARIINNETWKHIK